MKETPEQVREAMGRNFERLAMEPFIGHFLLKLEIKESTKFPTAAVDSRRMVWNPEFFASMANIHRIGVIGHEMVHVALGHPEWLGRKVRSLKAEGASQTEVARHLQAARIAADYVVNAIVIENMRLELPKDCLYNPSYSKHDLDTLYKYLLERGATEDEEKGEKAGGEIFPGRPERKPKKAAKKDEAEGEDKPEDETEGEDGGSEDGEDGDEAPEGEPGDGEAEDDEDGADEDGGGDGEGGEDLDDFDGEGDGEGDEDGDGEESDEDFDGGDGGAPGWDPNEDGDDDFEPSEPEEEFSEDGYETDAEAEEAEREYNETAVAAQKFADKMGSGAGWMKAVYDKIANPEVDWRAVLAAFMTASAETKRAYARPNRYTEGSGAILPTRGGRCIGTVVIALDSSGSMFSEATLSSLCAETEAILNSVEAKEVWLVGCDSRIQGTVKYEGGNLLEIVKSQVLLGGGGTDFRPVFRWIAENNIIPDCLVYMTDLAGSFPSPDEAGDVRTLWLGVETHEYWEQNAQSRWAAEYPNWTYVRQSIGGM